MYRLCHGRSYTDQEVYINKRFIDKEENKQYIVHGVAMDKEDCRYSAFKPGAIKYIQYYDISLYKSPPKDINDFEYTAIEEFEIAEWVEWIDQPDRVHDVVHRQLEISRKKTEDSLNHVERHFGDYSHLENSSSSSSSNNNSAIDTVANSSSSCSSSNNNSGSSDVAKKCSRGKKRGSVGSWETVQEPTPTAASYFASVSINKEAIIEGKRSRKSVKY